MKEREEEEEAVAQFISSKHSYLSLFLSFFLAGRVMECFRGWCCKQVVDAKKSTLAGIDCMASQVVCS